MEVGSGLAVVGVGPVGVGLVVVGDRRGRWDMPQCRYRCRRRWGARDRDGWVRDRDGWARDRDGWCGARDLRCDGRGRRWGDGRRHGLLLIVFLALHEDVVHCSRKLVLQRLGVDLITAD